MSALLPENCEAQTIDQLSVGESAWTVPWAMWVDTKRQCWLHPKYTIYPSRGGTVQLLITRQLNGYRVIARNDHKWILTERPCYAGNNQHWIPVVSFNNGVIEEES